MTGCPKCGRTNRFGGTVIWCPEDGWVGPEDGPKESDRFTDAYGFSHWGDDD
jgi:hypothetical protein